MPSTQRILVVDDEPGIRDGLKFSLEQLGYDVETAESGERAVYQFKKNPGISFVLSDYKMPGMDGFDVLKEIKKQSPETPVVLMTGFGSIHHAVEAMQNGADDYLAKPFSVTDLEKIIDKRMFAVPSIKHETRSTDGVSDHPRIITQSSYVHTLLIKAERAAKSSAPILIEGPSGTGKELFARQIHLWSARRDRPWVAVNCAALPGGLLESELFGYEKGAFTGAVEKKPGRFEQAHEGTILLDEIGELDPLLQAKLLRVLQEGELDRLGGRKPIKIDVRIIATTNRNLERLVKEGKFREDLYFRLYGVKFDLPALRDRAEDIPLLAQEFLQRQSLAQGTNFRFGEGVLEQIQKMPWTGNVRELERAVERAAVLTDTGVVEITHFEFTSAASKYGPAPLNFKPITDDLGQKSMRDMEREIILKTLQGHQGNRTHTAKALGMSLRTLRHKLKVYRDLGVTVEDARQIRLGKNDSVTSVDTPLFVTSPASIDGEDFA
jgi:two-component system response regulator FlrC